MLGLLCQDPQAPPQATLIVYSWGYIQRRPHCVRAHFLYGSIMRFRYILFIGLLVLGVSGKTTSLFAQDSESLEQDTEKSSEFIKLPDIVVTPSRKSETVFEVDRTVHLVDSEDLTKMMSPSVPEALQETTGVMVQSTNRGSGAPVMRGMIGPQNLIVIDGIRFNNSTFRTGPNQYLSILDLSAFEQIEVLLGPGSVLYGSDAMGGVIHMLPFDWSGEPGFGGKANLSFASADLSTAVTLGSWWHDKTASVRVGGSLRNFNTLRAGDGVEQPISDYQQSAWHARGRVRTGDQSELRLTYMGGLVRDAGREDRLHEGRFRFYNNDDHFAYLDWTWIPSGIIQELRLVGSFHYMKEEVDRYRCSLEGDMGLVGKCIDSGVLARENQNIPENPVSRQDLKKDSTITPGFLAAITLGFLENRLLVSGGLELYGDFISSSGSERRGDKDPAWEWKEAVRGNFSEDSTYLSTGGYLHFDGDIVSTEKHTFRVSGGARVSHIRAKAPEVPGLGDVDYDFTGVVGTAGLRYLYTDTFMAYLNGSQGFRAPNLQESTVLGDTGSKFEVPNQDLDPERSNTLELGLRVQLFKIIDIHLTGFISALDNIIDERELSESEWSQLGLDPADVGDKPVVQRVNRNSGSFVGTEATLELGPFWDITPWIKASWIRGEVTLADDTSYPARRVPPLMGSAGLRYEHSGGDFYAEFFVRFAGDQDRLHPSDEKDLRICENPDTLGDTYKDSDLACPGSESWLTFNIRGGYTFTDFISANVSVTNLSDKRYHIHGSGVDAPGIGVILSLTGEL